jgi:hypothetical protein
MKATDGGLALVAPPLGKVSSERLGTSARGLFQPRRLKGLRVGVISESWPVWLEVLPSLGIECILAWENGQDFIRKCFSRAVPGISIVSLEKMSNAKLDLVFISGSPQFVRQKCSFCHDLSIVVTSRARGKRLGVLSRTNLQWTYVIHAEVGGVTDGSYWVGTNLKGGHIVSKRDPNCRVLRDVLNPTEGGCVLYDPPSRQPGPAETLGMSAKDEVLGPQSLLPIARCLEPLAAQSLFSATGWVRRSLSQKELASVFDVSIDFQKPWCATGPDLACLLTTPSKVLMSCSESLITRLEPLLKEVPWFSADVPDFDILPSALQNLPFQMEVSKAKAAKADDAEVTFQDWNDALKRKLPRLGLLPEAQFVRACDAVRFLMLRWWKRNLRKESAVYLDIEHGSDWRTLGVCVSASLKADRAAVADILTRSAKASYWDWDGGSTLIFWRWPKEFRLRARDGIPVFINSQALPRYRRLQPKPKDAMKAEMVRSKIAKVRDRGYIEPGVVESLTGFFDVPKAGGSDIRLVYDASKCGLNDAVWAPNYFNASPDSLFNLLEPGTWMGDIDIGEFFLNFPLDHRIRPYAGVDLTPYFGQERSGLIWERWSRCLMGFKPSPYNTALSFGWAEEIIRGNPRDRDLPFHWDHVDMNLPGSSAFNPCLPWVAKRRFDGELSSDMLTYCDDLRILGASWYRAVAAAHRCGSMVNFMGIQDASRKRRFPDRAPGAWAGTVALTTADGVFASVTQERWDKAKSILDEMWKTLCEKEGRYCHKQLLSQRGYLIYVARAFPAIRPYLKGIHLTVDSWRDGRDEEGWKDPGWCGSPGEDQPEAPEFVLGVKRLLWDLTALRSLFSADVPAVRQGHSSIGCFVSHLWFWRRKWVWFWIFVYACKRDHVQSWSLGIRRGWRIIKLS